MGRDSNMLDSEGSRIPMTVYHFLSGVDVQVYPWVVVLTTLIWKVFPTLSRAIEVFQGFSL